MKPESMLPSPLGRKTIRHLCGIGFCVAAMLVGLLGAPNAEAVSNLELPGCRDNTLGRNDDGSSSLVELPFSIDYYGEIYDAVYVNNNGNVTMDDPLSTYVPFDLHNSDRAIIAPFFGDVDTRPSNGGTVSFGETTYQGRTAFCVLWDEVGYYSNKTDKRNTFQLLVIDRGVTNFDVVFRYKKLQWELGSASNNVPAYAGFSNGYGDSSVQLAGSGESGAFLDGGPKSLAAGSLNSGEAGVWQFAVRDGVIGNDPRNVPPDEDLESNWWDWSDTDFDGLPDYWESNGVWSGDKYVNLWEHGARVGQRDAFLWVDVVDGEYWSAEIEEQLRLSFSTSPLGISLHILGSDLTVPGAAVPSPVDTTAEFFAEISRLRFNGTGLAGVPGSVPALAKYACVCRNLWNPNIGGWALGIKGDHLMVTVDEQSWLEDIERETGLQVINSSAVKDRINSVTLMHELGHLYGLGHHGAELSNPDTGDGHDPNYKSIMSYSYNAFGVPRGNGWWVDYSREHLINYDWQLGGEIGALSLVGGQHGEIDNFYSKIDEVSPGVEDIGDEPTINEMLDDPTAEQQIADAIQSDLSVRPYVEEPNETTPNVTPPPAAIPGASRLIGRAMLSRKRDRATVRALCSRAGCRVGLKLKIGRKTYTLREVRFSASGTERVVVAHFRLNAKAKKSARRAKKNSIKLIPQVR